MNVHSFRMSIYHIDVSTAVSACFASSGRPKQSFDFCYLVVVVLTNRSCWPHGVKFARLFTFCFWPFTCFIQGALCVIGHSLLSGDYKRGEPPSCRYKSAFFLDCDRKTAILLPFFLFTRRIPFQICKIRSAVISALFPHFCSFSFPESFRHPIQTHI